MTLMNDDELYQGYLAKVYQHTQGYQSYSLPQQARYSKTNVCITYGELLYFSVKKILQALILRPEDIFLDLGSGLGKCALQVFMQTDLNKVIGIEASSALHEQAQIVQLQVVADLPFFWEQDRELIFVRDNFLEANWQDATIIYTCSTCFTQELLMAIGDKINQQPSVKQVLSLRPLPTLQMRLKKVFVVECSWDSALCFYYSV